MNRPENVRVSTETMELIKGLNVGQTNAFHRLTEFRKSANRFFVLRGYAGTGKTFMFGVFCAFAQEAGFADRVLVTATTNKAAKVLRDKMQEFAPGMQVTTIYSLMGLRIGDTEEQPQLLPPDDKDKRDELDGALIAVDEASMVTGEVLGHIVGFAQRYNCKFMFIGDPAQLPPVEKEEEAGKDAMSPVWDLEEKPDTWKAELTEIRRYDGPIEKLATYLRERIFNVPPNESHIQISRDVSENKNGVYQVGQLAFEDWLTDAARKRLFLEDTKAIALAFTNKQVQRFNELIRRAMFGLDASEPYIVGDRVVFIKPFMRVEGKTKTCVARNRDEFRVHDIHAAEMEEDCIVFPERDINGELIANRMENGSIIEVKDGGNMSGPQALVRVKYKLLHLNLTDGLTNITVPVIHPDSKEDFNFMLKMMADYAKQQPKGWQSGKAWQAYWQHHGTVAHLDYAYAQTTHCSQGSTYEIVFVDVYNILSVRKASLKTRLQSLYVGITRASAIVVIN